MAIGLNSNLGQRRSVSSFLMNFGPQHPAAHGILKIGLALSGEVINRADLQFGLLHRGSEKLCESRSYSQVVPYADRMDYVANLIQEHSVVQSIESLDCAITPSRLVLSIRVVLDELSRTLNHLLTMSAICLDLGAMGPIFWAFEERELIMEVFERISGARMHTAIYRPFGLGSDMLFGQVSSDISWVIARGLRMVSGAFLGLLNNRAFRSRCAGIGLLSASKIKAHSIQGIIARAAGIPIDARAGLRLPSYGGYNALSLNTFLGLRGDCYDRFVTRSREILESFRVILQLLAGLERGVKASRCTRLARTKFVSMESVISHFKSSSYSPSSERGLGWSCIEGPKGGVSVVIIHSSSAMPNRLHLRSPVAHNLYLLGTAANGYTLADFVSTFCSLDVVLGEIDR